MPEQRPDVHPAPTDDDPDLERRTLELEKLRGETAKIKRELEEAKRPYIFRNPQLLTALIATLGALIGLYITAKTNYFQSMRLLSESAQKVAEFAKSEALQSKADADNLKREADSERKAAREISVKARKQTKDAESELASARLIKRAASQQVASAEADTEHERFLRTFTPDYIYDQQAQLVALSQSLPYGSYRWIHAPNLRRLTANLDGDWEKAKTSMPARLDRLDLSFTAPLVDLASIPGIGQLQSLTLALSPDPNIAVSVSRLLSARSLRALTIQRSSRRVGGLNDVAALSSLKELSIVTTPSEFLSPGELSKVTSLLISRSSDKPVRKADLAALASAKNLRTLRVDAPTDDSFFPTLHATLPDLTALALVNTFPKVPNGLAFPNVRTALFRLDSNSSVSVIFRAFPMVDHLSLLLDGQWSAEQFAKLLETIGDGYPTLRDLDISGGSMTMRNENRYQIVFPRMPFLEGLRVTPGTTGPPGEPVPTIGFTSAALPRMTCLYVDSQLLRRNDLKSLHELKYVLVSNLDEQTISELEFVTGPLEGLGILANRDFSPADTARIARVIRTLEPSSLMVDRHTERWIDRLPPRTTRLTVVFAPNGDLIEPRPWEDGYIAGIPSLFLH